ncbi:ATP-binding protein [Sanguibacter sp. 25GB23B1]|uniref:ATP-binding protein n=1 Tax=unclassified Sanguibacter TaxID=2645534 RepID=UPI0032AF103C
MTALPRAHPPHGFALVDTWTLNRYDDLVHLRAGVTEVITLAMGHGAPRTHAVTRGLVVVSSELATNALRYAGAPATVTLSSSATSYLLDVADPDPATVPALAHGRAPGDGGLGLRLAERLASSIGWFTTDRTKHVWATFSRDV